MNKFYGKVGYREDAVEHPKDSGIYINRIVEYPYYGDVVKNSRRLDGNDSVNPDISVGNSISIIADAYANQHFFAIAYVEWTGSLWTVSSVTVEAPRLILRLGEVYNGETAGPTGPSEDSGDD